MCLHVVQLCHEIDVQVCHILLLLDNGKHLQLHDRPVSLQTEGGHHYCSEGPGLAFMQC